MINTKLTTAPFGHDYFPEKNDIEMIYDSNPICAPQICKTKEH